MQLALKRIAIAYEHGGGKWPQLRSSAPCPSSEILRQEAS